MALEPLPRADNYFVEMCSGSEEGSYLRLIDFALGLRVREKKKEEGGPCVQCALTPPLLLEPFIGVGAIAQGRQLLRRNVQRFRDGLVFKDHRL